MMKKRINVLLIVLFSFSVQQTIAQEIDELVKEISEAIELDETQSKALETQMGKYATSLQIIFERNDQREEPDPQALLTDIKNAQEEYHNALSKDIGKAKFKEYEAFREKLILEILSEVAHLRLLDLQQPIKMSDEQVIQMKPIMANAMRETMKLLIKHIDSNLNVRTKLNIATTMKSIKKTMDRDTAQVLTSEQIRVWKELKEAASQQN